MRVCVVGGGLAGALLAWRLAQSPGVGVDLLHGPYQATDATDASGGAVRGYETHPIQRELAIASLAELLGSPVLRRWAGYQRTGSVYMRADGADLAIAATDIDAAFPGSVELIAPGDPRRPAGPGVAGRDGWTGLPGRHALVEHHAGYIGPARLRGAILADLAARPAVAVLAATLEAVSGAPAGPLRVQAAGPAREYDVVVLAVGAWTGRLLRANGLPDQPYRTKAIQYTVYATGPWRPPCFVDERTGLYGKPAAGDGLLLGVPTTEWDVPPGRAPVTAAVHERAAKLAGTHLPLLRLGEVRARVSAADCYCDPPILCLRAVAGAHPGLLTFTGGSGGAAKTVLAASHRAAATLTRSATIPAADLAAGEAIRNDQ
jgi:glycine/D-amino acid oxidase-like deaminating enzyme